MPDTKFHDFFLSLFRDLWQHWYSKDCETKKEGSPSPTVDLGVALTAFVNKASQTH